MKNSQALLRNFALLRNICKYVIVLFIFLSFEKIIHFLKFKIPEHVEALCDIYHIRYITRNSAVSQFLNGVFCIPARTELAWRWLACLEVLQFLSHLARIPSLHRYLGGKARLGKQP